MVSRRRIQQIATELLKDYPTIPTPIEDIIKNLGIKLLPYNMEDGISGILLIEKNNITIGYAKKEPIHRKRFTMAHELGHYMLHRDGELFIDKGFKAMYRPSSSNIPSTESREWEANEFAANILMPANALMKEIENLEVDYESDGWITSLADKFKVSYSAMSIRISRLGIV